MKQPRIAKPFLIAFALLALTSASVLAQTSPPGSRNTYPPAIEAPWLSGGVGDESLDEMRRAASAYNVHVLFTTRDGAYLANVPFSVASSSGQEMYAGVSDGPMLYLQLKPGSYQVSAEIDGSRQTRRVTVGSSQAPSKLSFVSKAQSDR